MSNQVHEIELTIDQAEHQIKLGEALERLQSNKDFKLVINQGYLENEAIRLVRGRSDPSMQTPELQAANLRDIDAIGSFLVYLQQISRAANLAERAIKDAETEIELINAERGE